MGHDMRKALNPDMSVVAKTLSAVGKPCEAQLLAYMDCIKRHSATEADSKCVRQKAALVACAGQMSGGARRTDLRAQLMSSVQKLLKAWSKYGY